MKLQCITHKGGCVVNKCKYSIFSNYVLHEIIYVFLQVSERQLKDRPVVLCLHDKLRAEITDPRKKLRKVILAL